MSEAPTAATDSAPSASWRIAPQGFFSRHYELSWGGQLVATLRMSLWTEGCEFTIAGHQFAIRRTSLWKDGFQLFAGDQAVCHVTKRFWSRQFELSSAEQNWVLQPASWISRDFQLLVGEQIVSSLLLSLGLDWARQVVYSLPMYTSFTLINYNTFGPPNLPPDIIGEWRALATLFIYGIACIVVGFVVFRRRDIRGSA